jgi:deoxyhypusine synthase
VKLESWFVPILKEMHKEQDANKEVFTASKIIRRMGLEINNEDSIFYWCAKNDIPVYCPAITDGAIGDMLYFHTYDQPGFIVDYVGDIRGINDLAVSAKKSGMIILGGGVIKHHICNANLMRNGANFAVFINTGVEMDGSDAGARPDEAVSWGKISLDAKPVKVWADATLVFPILVAETFARNIALAKRN